MKYLFAVCLNLIAMASLVTLLFVVTAAEGRMSEYLKTKMMQHSSLELRSIAQVNAREAETKHREAKKLQRIADEAKKELRRRQRNTTKLTEGN
jgi:hypothetical protein